MPVGAAGSFYPGAEDRDRPGRFAGSAIGNRPQKYDVSRGIDPLWLDLSLRALFEAPIVAELASRIESISAAAELEERARNMAEVEALSEEEIERQLKENTRLNGARNNKMAGPNA